MIGETKAKSQNSLPIAILKNFNSLTALLFSNKMSYILLPREHSEVSIKIYFHITMTILFFYKQSSVSLFQQRKNITFI